MRVIDNGNTAQTGFSWIIGDLLNFYWIFGYRTFSEPMSINLIQKYTRTTSYKRALMPYFGFVGFTFIRVIVHSGYVD